MSQKETIHIKVVEKFASKSSIVVDTIINDKVVSSKELESYVKKDGSIAIGPGAVASNRGVAIGPGTFATNGGVHISNVRIGRTLGNNNDDNGQKLKN